MNYVLGQRVTVYTPPANTVMVDTGPLKGISYDIQVILKRRGRRGGQRPHCLARYLHHERHER